MYRLAALFLCLVVSAPATAQSFNFCEELWVTRNMKFDRTGYCFGSVLGQGLFDNSNCTTNTPSVSAYETEQVGFIRDTESRLGCNIATGRAPWASIQAVAAYYSQFDPVPTPEDGGYGCWGYTGNTVPVRRSATPSAPVIGQLSTGLSWVSTHWGIPGWSFISVKSGPDGQTLATGWAPNELLTGSTCAQEAG